jgi:hypothetical protein
MLEVVPCGVRVVAPFKKFHRKSAYSCGQKVGDLKKQNRSSKRRL